MENSLTLTINHEVINFAGNALSLYLVSVGSAWDDIEAGLGRLASLTDCLDVPGLALRLVAHHRAAARQHLPANLRSLLAAEFSALIGPGLSRPCSDWFISWSVYTSSLVPQRTN